MSTSTTILGPYDDLSTSDKIIISGAVPHDVKNFLFDFFLPRRGATDKLICRSIYMLEAYLSDHQFLQEFDELTREEIVNNLLNSFITYLQTLDPKSLIPSDPTYLSPSPPTAPSYVKDILQ
jgi:hypothetical protein